MVDVDQFVKCSKVERLKHPKLNSHLSTLPLFNALVTVISNTANTDVMMSTNFVTFASFFFHFLVRAIDMPLMLTPAIETAPRGILKGRSMNNSVSPHLLFQRLS